MSNRFKGFEILGIHEKERNSANGVGPGDEFTQKIIFDTCYCDQNGSAFTGTPEKSEKMVMKLLSGTKVAQIQLVHVQQAYMSV